MNMKQLLFDNWFKISFLILFYLMLSPIRQAAVYRNMCIELGWQQPKYREPQTKFQRYIYVYEMHKNCA